MIEQYAFDRKLSSLSNGREVMLILNDIKNNLRCIKEVVRVEDEECKIEEEVS
jgi:hypothetical protein